MISWFEKNYKISLLVAVLIAIAMFYISSLENFAVSGVKLGTNLRAVLYHILAYFFLALFLNFSLVKGKNIKFIFIAILITLMYGITDEIHQYFVPGRNASISDVGINFAGIALASLFYLVSIEFRRKIATKLFLN